MLPTQSGFAEVNGTRLYYESAGSGHPLVLLHGFSLDTRMWDDQFAPFAQRSRVIRYDLRGFGKSAVPAGEPYRHSDDLRALMEHLHIARADLVGLSMGGGVALDFALDHPEMARALVLVDSTLGGYTMSDEWERDIRPVWATARAQGSEAAKAVWLAHSLFAPIRQNPSAASRFERIVSEYSGWHFVHRNMEIGLTPPAAQRLGEVRAPTLVVVGEREVRDFLDIAGLLAERIPGARTVVLPGAGHMSNMEAPERFNAAVLDFLSSR